MGAVARGLMAGAGSAVALAGVRVLLHYVGRMGDALGGAPKGAIHGVAGPGGTVVFAVMSACAGLVAAAATPPLVRSERTSAAEFALVAAASAACFLLADAALRGLRGL